MRQQHPDVLLRVEEQKSIDDGNAFGDDSGRFLAVDGDDNVLLIGQTLCILLPVRSFMQPPEG